MLIADIPVGNIDPSPYNSRILYPTESIEDMSSSMSRNGQLVTIRVRSSPESEGRFQLIYGHRRFYAAKRLGWRTIRAEVVEANDAEAMQQSLIENLERDKISDFEKARILKTLNTKFDKTYEEIGHSIGISKQHVGSYISMLELFDEEELQANPELTNAMYRISEHHARILGRVTDKKARTNLALMVVKEKISVRNLTNMVLHLRSWFSAPETAAEGPDQLEIQETDDVGRTDDIESITRVVFDEFKLAKEGNFEAFKKLHLIGSGFTIFPSHPPFELSADAKALEHEREWFYRILPKFSWKIEDLKVTVMGQTALSTLEVDYFPNGRTKIARRVRGTMVLTKRRGLWRILHEHWSELRDETGAKRQRGRVPNIELGVSLH